MAGVATVAAAVGEQEELLLVIVRACLVLMGTIPVAIAIVAGCRKPGVSSNFMGKRRRTACNEHRIHLAAAISTEEETRSIERARPTSVGEGG